ncbi:hypothetical protein V497_01979 [Pseudogymnoascus sp. VKM F-4516 (FW-969)]|nr:hypothetical protein V497_01979 [Pseudogymnoascus sp. VKM F-4516 (FW-969)]
MAVPNLNVDSTGKGKRPNFLVIVADDLGFSDCSCFGSEIQTPNIDSLAKDATGGTRFTSFHVAAACSPTRSMLMTGTDHHIAGLGQLSEFVRSSPAHQGQPGHEGYLNEKVVALPQLLQDDGYLTLMAGKWHLGLKKEYSPQARGFDKSFALLPGCANHYGYEPQYEDPVNEPPKFFETAVTALHMEDSEYVTSLPEDFYSSEFYASKMIQYLSERSGADSEKPFFAYLPFSAPHWPLQAPKASMDKYKGLYADGPEALRLKRVENLKKLGLIPQDVTPHPIITTGDEPQEWDSMNEGDKAKSARAMEAFAGMVDCMDENIGRVVDYLKSTGEYDNTFILFMSDNGAEGASYEALPIIGDDVVAHINRYYNNSLENIGRSDSFVWYGSRWAQAATAPSRLYKMFSTQGGCRVPLVMKPISQEGRTGTTLGGRTTDTFCTVMDIVPTILELAKISHPGKSYRGKEIAPLRGSSWVPYLSSISGCCAESPKLKTQHIHDDQQVTGWEICGSGAIRRGRYKITYVPYPKGPQRWELFDIVDDPGEVSDISTEKPDLFKELLGLWDVYKAEVGVVGLAGELPAKGAANGHKAIDEFEDTGKWIRFMGKSNSPFGVGEALSS